MKDKFSRRYQAALLAHLNHPPGERPSPSLGMGAEALTGGLRTLDMAKLHEQILVTQVLPGRSAGVRAALIKEAGVFFTQVITPIEDVRRDAEKAALHFNRIVAMLSQRTVQLAASNLELGQEVAQRKVAEESLRKSERHYSQLLAQSDGLQEQLRQLSRKILSAQEDERKRISRELHDVIAQTLTDINLRLATLKKEAALNVKGLDRNIARTQMLVEKSVHIVHQFARELRPAVLDDLGLIPALQTYLKSFTARTGVHAHLTAFARVEDLDTARRTVLFRVAQEALTNVERHARAGQVAVNIRKVPHGICMKIQDNGRSFSVPDALHDKRGRRLGLLGMRERLEMIAGRFEIKSLPGKGTVVTAWIPLGPSRPGRGKSTPVPPERKSSSL